MKDKSQRLRLLSGDPTEDEVLVGIGRAAYKYRQTGMSIFEIAERLQVTESVIRAGITITMKSAAEFVTAGAKEDLLNMELDRLDALQQALWNQAMAGDVRATEGVLKVMGTRHKLLGLEARQEQTTHNAVVISSEGYLEALKAISDGSADG
jgi:hypothetical protein